jgi:pimeloyl-ACP methyl ester carboxylesterase
MMGQPRRKLHTITLRESGRQIKYYIDGPIEFEQNPSLIRSDAAIEIDKCNIDKCDPEYPLLIRSDSANADNESSKYQNLPVIFAFHGMYLSGVSLLQDETPEHRPSTYIVIAINRPGYHGSSNVEIGVYSYVDFANDIKEIADSLNIIKFGVVGHSSGGPNTLACASILGPSRVTAFATLASDPEYYQYDDIGTGHDGWVMDCFIGNWLPRILSIVIPCIGMNVSNGMRNDYRIERIPYPFNIEESITQKSIIFIAENDKLLPRHISTRVYDSLSSSNNSELKIIPNIGHMELLEDKVLNMTFLKVIELGKLRSDNTDTDTTNNDSTNNNTNDDNGTTTKEDEDNTKKKSKEDVEDTKEDVEDEQELQEQQQKQNQEPQVSSSTVTTSTAMKTIDSILSTTDDALKSVDNNTSVTSSNKSIRFSNTTNDEC